MRWGITLLAWTLVAIYLADSCLDYVRVWQNPPPGYSQEQLFPYITACGKRKSVDLAMASVLLVALYFGSGWAIARFRGGAPDSE